MNEFPLTANRKIPSIPEIGGDALSHTRALTAVRENLEVGARRSGNLAESFVRVSELVALGIAEIQGGKLVVLRSQPPPTYTTAARDGLVNVQDGTIIYNSTIPAFQGRVGGAWVNL